MKTYSTGDIAKLCDVNLRTVIRWIERGDLEGFKLPGRGNNRVTHSALVAFAKAHDMPLASELSDGKRRVLIVDDELGIAKAIARVLRREGFETQIATGGFEAGLQFAELHPELITLDLSMPEMDGISVIEHVRATKASQGVKILVISAAEPALLERAVQAGANESLHKPFTNDELLIATRRLMANN